MSKIRSSLPGFTLLELLIATVLGSILLLSATALFMTFMIGNANTNARRQMSAEGIQMLGTLEYHIRNAKSATCGGGNQTLTLDKLDGSQAPANACFTRLSPSDPLILHFNKSGACANNALHSNFVITSGSSFTCAQDSNGKTTVTVKFTLGTSEDASITETFSRIIQLRNS